MKLTSYIPIDVKGYLPLPGLRRGSGGALVLLVLNFPLLLGCQAIQTVVKMFTQATTTWRPRARHCVHRPVVNYSLTKPPRLLKLSETREKLRLYPIYSYHHFCMHLTKRGHYLWGLLSLSYKNIMELEVAHMINSTLFFLCQGDDLKRRWSLMARVTCSLSEMKGDLQSYRWELCDKHIVSLNTHFFC